MSACPNFEDSRYKYLVAEYGHTEAYRMWFAAEGNLDGVVMPSDRESLEKQAVKYANDIEPSYLADAMKEDPKETINFFIDQISHSESETMTAMKMMGPRLSEIIEKLRTLRGDAQKTEPLKMSDLVGKLQAEGKLGRKVGERDFLLNPDDYNPLSQADQATELAAMLNAKLGVEAVTTTTTSDGFAIHIDNKIYGLLNDLSAQDKLTYRKFLIDNLFTNKDNPVTTELINNAAKLAKDLGRPDLVNVSRLIYNYLRLNPTLKVRMVNSLDDLGEGVKGYYSFHGNEISLSKDMIGSGTLENETETVLHEHLHALTVQPWHKEESGRTLSQPEKEFKHLVESYYEYFKARTDNKDRYAFTNAREFLVGALLDNRFKGHLQTISDRDEKGDSFFTSFMKNLVRGFLKLFGIDSKESVINKLDPKNFEKSLFDATNDYLSKMDKVDLWNGLKEQGRDYGLDFSITAEDDWNAERQKIKELKDKFTEVDKNKIKTFIGKSILQLKSISANVSNKLQESKGEFVAIFKKLQKLEDDAYGVDQVDFFFDFASEINAIINIAYDKASKLDGDQSVEPDRKLKEYENIISAARSFDPILDEIQKLRRRVENVGADKVVADIKDMLDKRKQIESIYSEGVFPLVTDKFVGILSDASKKAIDIERGNIAVMKSRLDLALKNGSNSRAKRIEKNIETAEKNIRNQLYLDADKVESWLRGQMGDSNLLSVWLQAGISSGNPIVSGLSKYIRDTRAQAAPQALKLQNSMQSEVEQYQKATGRSLNKISEFNSPLIQTYTKWKLNDKEEYVKDTQHALLNQFNGNHIEVLQDFRHKLSELGTEKRKVEDDPFGDQSDNRVETQRKIKELDDQAKKIRNERRQFLRDYMEQPYDPRVHEAKDMIYKDLGGFTAWDYLGPKYSTAEDIQDKIDQTNDENILSKLYDQLDELNRDIKRLRSLYGKSPDSREYAVAQLLKDQAKLMTEYSKFELTPKGRIKFEGDMARLKRQIDKGDISQSQYDRAVQANTTTQLSQEYWDTKNGILKDMADILEKMGAKNEKNSDLSKLYSDMEDIVKPYRDADGIIDGQSMSDQELKDVKSTEEALEKAKAIIPSLFGITKTERIELTNLYNQKAELTFEAYQTLDPEERSRIMQMESDVLDKIDFIESKKRTFPKDLLTRYFNLIGKLSKLDETVNTKYYEDELQEQTDQAKWKVDVSKIPNRFSYEAKTYQKTGDKWYTIDKKGPTAIETGIAENAWRSREGDGILKNSDWWKNNHLLRTKWVKNSEWSDSSPEGYSGEWQEFEDPTYAWRQTQPVDKKYVETGKPSIKYKTRIIKDEFINKNYKDSISGDVQPKLVGAKDNRFINQRYFDLEKSTSPVDKATFKFLKFLEKVHFDAQEAVPYSRRPGHDLPAVRQSGLERFMANSLKESGQDLAEHVGQIARLWNDDVKRNPQDVSILFGFHDDTSGIVPAKFLGDIESRDQSIDLARSLLLFGMSALERTQLQEAMPFAMAVRDIVNTNKPVKIKKGVLQTFAPKFAAKNTAVAQMSQSNNTAFQVNEIIKSEIYGERIKDEPMAKVTNIALGMGAKMLLGVNFVSSIQNYANAATQAMIESVSKTTGYITKANLAQANRIYFANVHELVSDMGKYGNKSYWNQFFDYFGGINFKIFGKDNKPLAFGKAKETFSSLSIPNTITEHMLNYQTGIALALNYRVKANVDGKEVMLPIGEAFTLKDRNLEIKPGYTVTEKDRQEFVGRMNSLLRRINGEYGDIIQTQKYSLGRCFLFMDRYAIPFVTKRYGDRKFSIQDGIREEGYWRLFGKLLINDIKSKSVPVLGGWKYYTPEEKVAVLKAATEFGFTVMFFLMIKALGGEDDKHLKDNSWLANYAIYALKGIQQQNETFMPVPGVGLDDIVRKIQNPFPIVGKLKNLVTLINDATHTMAYEMGLPGVSQSDVIYSQTEGWHKPGDLKVMGDLNKLLGVPQRIMQYVYPEQATKNIDQMSRIK